MHTIFMASRTPEMFSTLLEVWELSVRATHSFLSEEDVVSLRPVVAEAFVQIPYLFIIGDTPENPFGFLGASEKNIEMLFLHPDARGKGLGKQLVWFAINQLDSVYVDVNEANPTALGFYLHMGFTSVGRSETDQQGNPFPLLHLKIS